MAERTTLVIVGDETNSPMPTIQNGYLTIGAKQVKQPVGTAMIYDRVANTYTPVDFRTATPDYQQRLLNYQTGFFNTRVTVQAQQETQKNTWANTADPTQVNSFADVLTAGNKNYHPISGSFKALGQALQGDLPTAAKTWWDSSVFNTLAKKAEAGYSLVNNMTIKPLMSNEPVTTKAMHLGLNALTNLSETIDMVTGANTIKGFVQGVQTGGLDQGIQNIGKGFGLVDQYRTQFDWDTGSLLGDVALEVVSDPTSWLTFGGKAIIKSVGVPIMTDTIIKTAKETGIDVTRFTAQAAAKKIVSNFSTSKGTLENAALKLNTNPLKLATSLFTPDTGALTSSLEIIVRNLDPLEQKKFYSKLVGNIQLIKETKTFNVLNSVRSTMNASDEIQKRFAQAALVSSPAAIGYAPIKLLTKYAPQAKSYLTYAMNRTNKHVDDMINIPTTQLADEFKILDTRFNTMKQVIDGAGESGVLDEAYQDITRYVQTSKFNNLSKILDASVHNSYKALQDANTWAKNEGYDSLLEYRNALQSVPQVVPAELKAMATDLDGMIQSIYTREYAKIFKDIGTVLASPIQAKDAGVHITNILNTLRAVQAKMPYPDTDLMENINNIVGAIEMLIVQPERISLDTLNQKLAQLSTKLNNEVAKLHTVTDNTSHLQILNDARLAKLIGKSTDLGDVTALDRLKEIASEQGTNINDLLIPLNTTGRADVANHFTAKQLLSKMHTLKISEVASLSRIFNTEEIDDAYNLIRNDSTVRSILRLMGSDEIFKLDPTIQPAVNKLLEDASSFYVGKKLMNNVLTDPVFTDTFKNAALDVLSGMTQLGYTSIGRDFTTNIMTKTRKYIDGKNNAHPALLKELISGSNTKAAVQSMAYKLEHTDVYPEYKGVFDTIATENVYHDVFYSVGYTGYKHGSIHEITLQPVGGAPITIMNKDFNPNVLDTETIRNVYGMSRQEYLDSYNVVQAQRANDPDVIMANNDTFIYQVYEQMQKLTGVAKTEEKSMRLIGFNSASESLSSDFLLNQFFRKSNLNMNILYDGLPSKQGLRDIYTLDVAQHYRILNNNAVSFPNDWYTRLDKLFSNTGEYLDAANKSLDFTGEANVKMLPNVNVRTLEALDNIVSILASYAAGTAPEIKDTLDTMLRSVDVGLIQRTYTTLSTLMLGLSKTLKEIGETNDKIGSYVIMQDQLKNVVGDPNVMAVLNKLYTADGILPISTKKIYDPDIFKEWFPNLPAINHTIITKFADESRLLQRSLSRITQPQLLLEIPTKSAQDMVSVLLLAVQKEHLLEGSYTVELYRNLGTGRTNLHSFVIANELYKIITAAKLPEDSLSALLTKLQRISFTFLDLLDYADDTVFARSASYLPGIPVVRSKGVQPDAVLMRAAKEHEAIKVITQKAKTLMEAINIENTMQDMTGNYLPAEQARKQLLMPFFTLQENIRLKLEKVMLNNNISNRLTPLRMTKFNIEKESTLKINKVLMEIDDLSRTNASYAMTQMFSMDADTYQKFLFRKTTGVQVVQLNTEFLQMPPVPKDSKSIEQFEIYQDKLGDAIAMAAKLEQFKDMLDSPLAKTKHIKYAVKEHYMFVYLDAKALDLNVLAEETKTFVHKADYNSMTHSFFGEEYYKYMEAMSNIVDPSYALSTHNVLTAERHNELLAFLPKEVADQVISHNYLVENDMFSGLYNYTLLGDYGMGVGEIYKTHSTNILTNIASGFNATYKKFNSIDSYASLLFNPMNSLGGWLKDVSKFGTVRLDEAADALKQGDRVVASLFKGKVVQLDVSTPRLFQKAVDHGAVVLDYYTYNNAVEIINEHTISSPVVQWLNRHYLAPLKVGQLLSVGWVMRNIPDSVSKGLVQAGDLHYVSSFVQTMHIKAKFDNTLTHLYKTTKGILNKEALHKFFVDNAGNKTFLDEDLFDRVLAFTRSSSALPTQKQLDLLSDVADNIYRNLSADESINLGMVEHMLEVYNKAGTDLDAIAQLSTELPAETVSAFMQQIKYIPKYKKTLFEKVITEDFLPSKMILASNNKVETTIRLHTFLYHNEYKGESFAKALHMVDESQFNRARDTIPQRWLETVMPFSSFAIDNVRFWADTAGRGNNVIAIMEDVYDGLSDPEEFDTEEMMRNQSLAWSLLQGNLILNDNGLTYKSSDSAHSALEFFVSPVQSLSDMWHTSVDTVNTIAGLNTNAQDAGFETTEQYLEYVCMLDYKKENHIVMTADEKAFLYTATTKDDVYSSILNLIPVAGVLYQRYHSVFTKYKPQDQYMPFLMPSLFSYTKLDSAGTTYQGRPIGYDWYSQTQEYKDTHQFVYGVSYVPKWLAKDPAKYIDTYGRLKAMGYSDDEVGQMLAEHWYFDKNTYELKQYKENSYTKGGKSYAKRTYAKKTYAKRSYPVWNKTSKKLRKGKKFYIRNSKQYTKYYSTYAVDPRVTSKRMYPSAYRNVKYFGLRNLAKDNYAKYGARRSMMIQYAGESRSTVQLMRSIAESNRRKSNRRF